MPIPAEHTHRTVSHFTHIENLPEILEHGLLSTNEKDRLGIGHNTIAYNDIQCRRAEMQVPCGTGGLVHDYVPLYFCIRSPMLNAVVTNKIADEQLIVYLEFPISIMDRYSYVFTDASANTFDPPNFFTDPSDLNRIDWNAVQTWKWSSKHDEGNNRPIRQRKMAELLIHRHLPITEILRVVVWNNTFKEDVVKIFDEAGLVCPTVIAGEKKYYFYKNSENLPSVIGPRFIKIRFDKTINEISDTERPAPENTRYAGPGGLLNALSVSLEALPETAELVGLGTENPMHGIDVGEHTLAVVNGLTGIPEFECLEPNDRYRVKIAAYLHDIGKGPRSRWPDGRQRVDEDHPVKALPMLKRILTKEIVNVHERTIKTLCKLVCYHDIIGGIIAHGRRAEELEEIIEDKRDLDMLIALCKADINAINVGWCNDVAIDRLKERIVRALNERAAVKL